MSRTMRWFLGAYGAVLLGIGLLLAVPGWKLLMLGGSPYYICAGVAMIGAGGLLIFGDRRGAYAYFVVLAATMIWAVWEVGFDGWGLVPRLVGPIVLAIPLLIAVLVLCFPQRRRRVALGTLLGCAVALTGVAALGERAEAPSAAALASSVAAADSDWPFYGNGQDATRHADLAQITPQNVGELKIAWSVHLDQPANGLKVSRFEGTPLKIGNLLYACTSLNDVAAIDPVTGRIRWRFKAGTNGSGAPLGACRGLAYYRLPQAEGACAQRIYTATVDARLLAVDALTGRPCPGFGRNGQVDLLKGMGANVRGYYSVTSPPQLVRGKLVVGGYIVDGQSVGEPSGVIRAFDAVTGQFAWAWDMARPDNRSEPAEGQTYTPGTPNSWAPMSADDALGLVYVPTGNATPDYFGAHRTKVMDTYSSSLVALDADSGALRWSFQTVHHDVWDYDVSVQPTLIDLPVAGGTVPAVALGSKGGQLFLLNRRTGKPIFPVRERPVPQKPVPFERLSPTQPHSALPSFAGAPLTERDMWGATPIDQLWCRVKFREARYEGPYTPPGLKPSIVQPGFTGGIEWGSMTYDPRRRLLLLASNDVVNYNRLIPRVEAERMRLGTSSDPGKIDWGIVPQTGVPYAAETRPFLAPTGSPCQRPPYGRINAVDLKSGKLAWSRPLGTAEMLGPFETKSGLPITMGTPTLGGPMTTASGLTFIGASLDHHVRAYETATGRLLWRAKLPGNGTATPMTYSAAGKQYVIIAVGDESDIMSAGRKGGGAEAKSAGGTIVAFALP